MESAVTFEAPKVAMSDDAFGTVLGTQLAAVFQSPLVGLVAQVALPAREGRCAAENSSAAATKIVKLFLRVFMDNFAETRSLPRSRNSPSGYHTRASINHDVRF